VIPVELVSCDAEELTDSVEGEEAEELREEEAEACNREMLGFCGRALARSDDVSASGRLEPSVLSSS